MYADATRGCETLSKQVYKYAFEPTGLLGGPLSSTLRHELYEKSVLPTSTTPRPLSEIEPRKLTPHLRLPRVVVVHHALSGKLKNETLRLSNRETLKGVPVYLKRYLDALHYKLLTAVAVASLALT